jgi:hypothetical protein
MVEDRRSDPKGVCLEENIITCGRRAILSLKGRAAAKLGGLLSFPKMDLGDDQAEVGGIVLDQVPSIGSQLVFHLIKKSGRAEKDEVFLSSEANPHQTIEAHKMIHVSVGDKNMGEA